MNKIPKRDTNQKKIDHKDDKNNNNANYQNAKPLEKILDFSEFKQKLNNNNKKRNVPLSANMNTNNKRITKNNIREVY